jgi:hypothetical protein
MGHGPVTSQQAPAAAIRRNKEGAFGINEIIKQQNIFSFH